MREYWVHVEHDFDLPVDRVYDYLSEHENLGPLFGARITRVNDGDASRNGVGSRRLLRVGPMPPFEETVTKAQPGELIEYRITHGGMLRNHVGIMKFSPLPGGGSHLDYRIRLASHVPGLAAITKVVLTRAITKGLPLVDRNG